MKTLYSFGFFLIFSFPGIVSAQIIQSVNKSSNSVSNQIIEIDSIRFNSDKTKMEIILKNGSTESHEISGIKDVTFSGKLIGEISSLKCNNFVLIGSLVHGVSANEVSVEVGFEGGNGGLYEEKIFTSTGIEGLTANLKAGKLSEGNGSLIFNITGTPSSHGIAKFKIIFGGQECLLEINIVPGQISFLECADVFLENKFIERIPIPDTKVEILYRGGNGGVFKEQTFKSTKVEGLTAILNSGTFSNGDGSIILSISGSPLIDGKAIFTIEVSGIVCTIELEVTKNIYPKETLFCGDIYTEIIDVINPRTGRVWMDRNLGASQAATHISDNLAYGDLYQWGRGADGHQCRNSGTTTSLSSTDQPNH
ncbi:hypothetical protein [Mongoliitalea lutea]|uniref:Uncharacterized protein n=1 Tax=Mongoliitalea lutea TaxID=849756 RepID=A0A8J3G807_9BACT|nr:hypothetical protein [Mongoliitalea lutea]GHB53105.1 hypothetical protein GCM10008106_37060 [Mongoliitalea lutea]